MTVKNSQKQAITENLVIITKDGIIPQYDVNVLW